MAFTSRTRTKGSVAHEGTTDAPRNGEVLKKEFWNEGMSRPVPKAPPGFREGEEEPENTKGKNRVNTEKEKKETNQKWTRTLVLPRLTTRQRCSERESQSESDEEAKIGRSKPRMAFTSRTRTKGSVAHEGTTDAPRNGEVLKKEFWNEGMSRPVPKAPPGFREGEEEPKNTKQERSYQEPKARERANRKRPKTPTGAARKARRSKGE
ncbi:hypothetical protein C8F01DRAFT_1352990 [Mycena amicta]|nr:hypothetical protein C8F01DRAFT_1352990 [Mycena amicta]